MLEDGRLTDNKGRVVDFKNTIIIMTSNIGSHLIQQNFENVKRKMTFTATENLQSTNFDVKRVVNLNFQTCIEVIMFKPLLQNTFIEIVKILNNLKSN